jgi:methionine biosynthesis protein MetW
MSSYAELVGRHGLSHSHRLVLEAVPDGSRVLDVGCATGYLAAPLAARGDTVIGVEMDATSAAAARSICEQVIEGDIEAVETRERLPRGVDVVLFADVLEHLHDPWETLTFARALLAPGGRAVVSLPNIAHWTARRALMSGSFPYADFGLFDRTHLRFFTRATAHELAGVAGFRVTSERSATAPLPLERFTRRWLGGTEQQPAASIAALRETTARRFPELMTFQFVLALEPLDAS